LKTGAKKKDYVAPSLYRGPDFYVLSINQVFLCYFTVQCPLSMKQFLKIFSLICLISTTAFAQSEVNIISQISHVTVFTNRAQIEAEASTLLKQGMSKIIISDIASTIDAGSIQVGGRGDFTLLSVNFQKDFISKRTLKYQENIKKLAEDLKELDMKLKVLSLEEKMVMDNTKIKSDTDDLYKDDLEELSLYFRKKLTSIGTARLKIEREIGELQEQKSALQKQLDTDPSRNLPLGKIILTVKTNSTTKANLKLKYLAYGAGWTPTYDVRVQSTELPFELSYKANVFQNTGVDWDNVMLSLSTASINKRTIKPELNPQFLYFYENRPPSPVRMMKAMAAPSARMEADVAEMGSASNFSEVVENELSSQFDISIPYTVNSGSTETVEVQNLSINAKYVTYVVPKYDDSGFLVAEVKGWKQYNLRPATANIYFEDNFIGKSFVGQGDATEELKISLGRDERVQVKREEITDFKSRKTFGSNIRENFGYEISIKNTKSTSVNLSVEDQIPVSQDSDIEIDIEQLSGGLLNEQTGKITWDLTIPSAQSRQLFLKYMVKYPKDKQVTNL
jgi:uncharacterized protein (TIGR02231 family)